MSDKKQLDLFIDTPKPTLSLPVEKACKVECEPTLEPQPVEFIAFPYRARIGRARHVARLLRQKPSQRAKGGYWRQVVNQQVEQLERIGLAPYDIESEIAAFHRLVEQILSATRPQREAK